MSTATNGDTKAPPKEYDGPLRLKVTPLGDGRVALEWHSITQPDGSVDPNVLGELIWCETVKPADGLSFVSQIVCDGRFEPSSGPLIFIDAMGRRHFVMDAEPGRLGAKMGG